MRPDGMLSKAFEREVEAAPYRSPTEAEIGRALDAATPRSEASAGSGAAAQRAAWPRPASPRLAPSKTAASLGAELAPILALAAALIVAVRLEPAALLALRPLARGFSSTIQEGTGDRFYDFVIEAGDAYRSSKRGY